MIIARSCLQNQLYPMYATLARPQTHRRLHSELARSLPIVGQKPERTRFQRRPPRDEAGARGGFEGHLAHAARRRNVKLFNRLIAECARRGNLGDARRARAAMEAAAVPANEYTHAALVNAAARGGDAAAARAFFDAAPAPGVAAWGALIQAYCAAGDVAAAAKTHAAMAAAGVAPNRRTFLHVARGWLAAGDGCEVLATLGAPWFGRLLMTSSAFMPVMVSCCIVNSPSRCQQLVWHLSVPRKNVASTGGNEKDPSGAGSSACWHDAGCREFCLLAAHSPVRTSS